VPVVPDAYYLPLDADHFTATTSTAGPWDDALQHGGPPSALLARAVEQTPSDRPSTVVRMSVDLLGPVPVGPVELAGRVLRPGRSVELVEAELSAGGRVAARALAWRVREATLQLPDAATELREPPAFPELDDEPDPGWTGGFITSLQTRFAAGGWSTPGPATLWARMRVPLVDGEAPTGLQRLMVLADCGNGISSALPISDWMFINPDLSVHLTRAPEGEWLCLQAETRIDPARGFGLASSRVYDRTGQVATGAQSLFVTAR
jgi:Thioesterase-like superfamily